MPMPEASVDENAGMVFGQHYVWRHWKRTDILTKTEAESEQFLAQDNFRGRVP